MNAVILASWLIMNPAPAYHGVQSWPQSYDPIINYHAGANLIPRFLAHAIIREESHFHPNAQSYQWDSKWVYDRKLRHWVEAWFKTDKVLARGMAQVSANQEHEAEHVKNAGMRLEDYDWRNPGDSLRVGMAYLGAMLRYFKYEIRPSVASYNAGRGAARAWWNDGRELPRETARYMRNVLGLNR